MTKKNSNEKNLLLFNFKAKREDNSGNMELIDI